MSRWSPQVKLWVFSASAVCVLLLVLLALPHPAVSVGRTIVTWRLTRVWSIGSWSGRETTWDEPAETIPPQPPCQFHQVRSEQMGPLLVVMSRRVPPQPGEVCE